MFQIFENGKALKLEGLTFDNPSIPVLDFAKKLNECLNEQGRTLVSLNINNENYSLDKLTRVQVVNSKDQIEIHSDSPLELGRQGIQEALNQLQPFIQEIDQVVDLLIQGNKEKAFQRFTRFLENFRDIIALLQTLETMIQLDFNKIKVGEITFQTFVENLIKVLQELLKAMEKEDLVALTDVLDYELKEIFSGDLKLGLEILLEILTPASETT